MATARSIAQVSQDSVRLERVRGTVQTVFPIRGCMPPTANQSETQDYGRVGSDGPIEGATKVIISVRNETPKVLQWSFLNHVAVCSLLAVPEQMFAISLLLYGGVILCLKVLVSNER